MALSTIRRIQDGEWQQVQDLIRRVEADYGVVLSEYDLDDNSWVSADRNYERARRSLKRRYRYLMWKLDLPPNARMGYGYWGIHVD